MRALPAPWLPDPNLVYIPDSVPLPAESLSGDEFETPAPAPAPGDIAPDAAAPTPDTPLASLLATWDFWPAPATCAEELAAFVAKAPSMGAVLAVARAVATTTTATRCT